VNANITLPIDTLGSAPQLLPLAANGGPTRTHALTPGSPAIDAGNNLASLTSDQRGAGFPRVVGAAADIGAFEGAVPVLPARPPVPAPAASGWALGVMALALAWLGIRRGLPRTVGQGIFTHFSPWGRHSSHR
jgi:hypothetical protein